LTVVFKSKSMLGIWSELCAVCGDLFT